MSSLRYELAIAVPEHDEAVALVWLCFGLWSMNQLTTAIQHLVKSEDPAHAECWYRACTNLINPAQRADAIQVEEAVIQRKREVLIQGFGRAKGLLDAALEWREPRIGKNNEDALGAIRGALWRHVMAYSGWELLAKSVLWDVKAARSAIHPAFDMLLDSDNRLQPPHANRAEAPEKLIQWLKDDAAKERWLPDFLGLNMRLSAFPRWLVNESHTLSEQQVLAAMRHIVAHGALSPTKAVQWGLQGLYDQGPNRLKLLTCRLMAELTETL